MSDRLKFELNDLGGEILRFEMKKDIDRQVLIEIVARILADNLTYDEVGAAAARYQEIAAEKETAQKRDELLLRGENYDWSYER